MSFVREPIDLIRKVREKYIRNKEYIDKAIKICEHTNSIRRITGPLNLVMLLRQFRKRNFEIVRESLDEYRWILPTRNHKNSYYNKHHDACYTIPPECHFVSMVFSAEKAHFEGGSIRVRFFAKRYKQIFEKMIIVSAEVRTRCWEFTRPKNAVYISVSFCLQWITDNTEPEIPKREMLLRSEIIKTKPINPPTDSKTITTRKSINSPDHRKTITTTAKSIVPSDWSCIERMTNNSEPETAKRKMVLRSETTTKFINPVTGKWCYKK